MRPARTRVARVVSLTVVLWFLLAWVSTEYSPIRDCYEIQNWNGKLFLKTGQWKCL